MWSVNWPFLSCAINPNVRYWFLRLSCPCTILFQRYENFIAPTYLWRKSWKPQKWRTCPLWWILKQPVVRPYLELRPTLEAPSQRGPPHPARSQAPRRAVPPSPLQSASRLPWERLPPPGDLPAAPLSRLERPAPSWGPRLGSWQRVAGCCALFQAAAEMNSQN